MTTFLEPVILDGSPFNRVNYWYNKANSSSYVLTKMYKVFPKWKLLPLWTYQLKCQRQFYTNKELYSTKFGVQNVKYYVLHRYNSSWNWITNFVKCTVQKVNNFQWNLPYHTVTCKCLNGQEFMVCLLMLVTVPTFHVFYSCTLIESTNWIEN